MKEESRITLSSNQKILLINAINLFLEKEDLDTDDMRELRELKKKISS